MRTNIIVLSPPPLKQDLRLEECAEDLPIEQFISELSDKRFHIPFAQGLPGSINSVLTPTDSSHLLTAFAVNSEPLS